MTCFRFHTVLWWACRYSFYFVYLLKCSSTNTTRTCIHTHTHLKKIRKALEVELPAQVTQVENPGQGWRSPHGSSVQQTLSINWRIANILSFTIIQSLSQPLNPASASWNLPKATCERMRWPYAIKTLFCGQWELNFIWMSWAMK